MSERYIVQHQYGEWCVMDAPEHSHVQVTIAVGCPIGQGGTGAGREYAQRIARAMNERDALRAVLETLCNGLKWNIENHPDIMNEADNEALAEARALLGGLAVRSAGRKE